MQPLARAAPDRLAGLFFFDFVHGLAARVLSPTASQSLSDA
jgi:hypothetical protein